MRCGEARLRSTELTKNSVPISPGEPPAVTPSGRRDSGLSRSVPMTRSSDILLVQALTIIWRLICAPRRTGRPYSRNC